MTALAKIKKAGFTLALLDDGNLKISPFSKLTDQQRDYIKIHKAEIIADLKAANDAIPKMEDWQRAAIAAWIKSLGGSDTEIAEEIQETIQQCETDMEARLHYLQRAAGTVESKPTPNIIESDDYPKQVIAWTPNGNPVVMLASDAEQEAFILAANPKPAIQPSDTRKYCRQCTSYNEYTKYCVAYDCKQMDDLPRHCDRFNDNGAPPPTADIRSIPEPPKPVKCNDCQHFKRFDGYGNSSAGECLQKVMPSGITHYGSVPKFCDAFKA